MSITEKRLTEIQARVEDATEGPWFVDGPAQCGPGDTLTVYPVEDGGTLAYVQPSWGDAEFISRAREDIPALLAEVERLRAELAKAREVTEEKITEAVYGSMEVNCELRVMENMQTTWCEAHDSEVDAADRCFHVWDIVDPALTTALNGCDDA